MGKLKNKSHDELEHLRGIIREQRSEIRYLKREIKRLTPAKYRLKELEEIYEDVLQNTSSPKEREDVQICEQCGKGLLNSRPLPFGYLVMCNLCSYRKMVRKPNEDK